MSDLSYVFDPSAASGSLLSPVKKSYSVIFLQ